MSQTIPNRQGTAEKENLPSMEEGSLTAAALHSQALLHEGQMEIVKNDLNKGLDFFQQACQLNPDDPKLYFEQGLSLFEYGSEEGREKTLLIASKKFKMATSLKLDYFNAWHLWAITLYHLGKAFKEYHYFAEAEEKLQKAMELMHDQSKDILADLYWDFGNIKAEVAHHSGEALDWQISLESFQKASTLQKQFPAEFWNQFGYSCLQLAKCINDVRLCVKSIHCFKHAISNTSDCYEGWQNLSKALQHLYQYTHDEDHFSQANECFTACAQIQPFDANQWLDWAIFLCSIGKRSHDVKKLRSSIEKCHKAYTCDSSNPIVLSTWGEALAMIGELTERIDLIHEGQNKISQALELANDIPAVWNSYGHCLNSFGRYFSDFDYHYQAIEKFQQGLSIDRTCHHLWHSIAQTYSHIGHTESDIDALEKSIRFFTKAIDLQPHNSYYHFEYAASLSKLGELSHDQKWLESSFPQFEKALHIQKNAVYLHPDWLFQYARTLDLYGDFHEEETYYNKAVEIFSHVLMIDPDFPQIHYHLALTFSHLGELHGEIDNFYRALHYFKLAFKHDEENDQIILDLGITLINVAQHTSDSTEAEQCYRDAEMRLTAAAKAGNLQAYYHLACLYSLLAQIEKAVDFLKKAECYDALPPIEEVLQDEWLDLARCSDEFKEFLSQLEKKPNLQEGK
jgi:tetratricopeptide (TPR) repeat protein